MKAFVAGLLLMASLGSVARAQGSLSPDAVDAAVDRSLGWLRTEQAADGSWTKLIRVSSVMYNAHMIFLYQFLGQTDQKRETVDGLARYIWSRQGQDGGFAGYEGGTSNASISILAYLAEKIAGENELSPRMLALEKFIVAHGGLKHAAQALPYLMAFGVDSDYRCVPGLFESLLLDANHELPWVRVVLYPFLHIWVSGGVRPLPESMQPARLGHVGFCPRAMPRIFPHKKDKSFWKWLDANVNDDGTLFDYTPTSVPALMAMATGGAKYAATLARGVSALESFQETTPEGIYQSPGEASIGETNGILNAMLEMGRADDPAVKRAESFLWSMQQKQSGAFGFSKHNSHFPDSDDTSNTIYILKRLNGDDPAANAKLDRALSWLLSVQNRDGGFGTWEKEKFGFVWSRVGKAMGGLVLSESVTEHTARIVVNLAQFRGREKRYDEAYKRAVKFLLSRQLPDGSYAGTWFVDYLFGTSMVVAALATSDDPAAARATDRALEFIFAHQNADGGFSESPASFLEGKSVPLASSSPAQTGLILSQLFTFFREEKYSHWAKLAPALERAEAFLLRTQKPDGRWHDDTWTGVTFPKVEYLIYELIQESAPMQSLAMWPIATRAAAAAAK
jgi:squalene-hopene/tetraprenyl-beta-curcumene cyclase